MLEAFTLLMQQILEIKIKTTYLVSKLYVFSRKMGFRSRATKCKGHVSLLPPYQERSVNVIKNVSRPYHLNQILKKS